MHALELVVLLGAVLVTAGVLAHRARAPLPVVLLVLGALIGFVPGLAQVHLPPELMLLVFLPALLFWDSITSSVREIRFNLRGVVLTSTVLVGLTAAAVAYVAHLLGMPWGAAWVLGAALAPTDATATGVLARLLPRRNVAILRAESLINDGTALVLYGVAVGVTVGGLTVSAGRVAWLLVLSYVGGLLAGASVAWLTVRVRSRAGDARLANAVGVLTPFASFLLAEKLGASGVFAVVVSGLVLSQVGPRTLPAAARRQGESFWSLGTYLLNGALFILVGVEIHSAVGHVSRVQLTSGLLTALAVWAAILVVRIGFLFASAYTIRLVDRRPSQRLRRVSNRARVVSTVAGFRGAVSLAAAPAVPTAVRAGGPFPSRDMVVFVTAVVVALTLIVQGVLLPPVVRWARFAPDTASEDEHRLAEQVATRGALDAVRTVGASLGIDEAVIERTAQEYREHLQVVEGPAAPGGDHVQQVARQYAELRLALIAKKRQSVLQLRDERRIDDAVLRQVQAQLDLEELRLSPGGLHED